MRAANRKSILLLDNASSYTTKKLVLANVKIHMLPPNTTAFLQPINAEIITTLEGAYKTKQMEQALSLVEENDNYEWGVYAVDQLVAMQ
ncbi:hypothetical protein PI124_g3494 [Phytophthora idaei]|nr:hypothetical protein PI125_g2857 [Phytophthora idaei]KAG3173692.1 hypothetical protein PI126_g708 [Phytophthora idaei]KAG3251875.1 hypothetical protein PI124_g3494 [Phytophthora idaei]